MGRERWFRGDREGRDRPFDWYALAKDYGIPEKLGRELYEEAIRRARQQYREPQRHTEAVYIELLEEARLAAYRPSPGKITRTMLLQAERAGKKPRKSHLSRLTGQPIAPGKRTSTSYLEPPSRQRQGAARANRKRDRLEAIAESFRALGLPVPADLENALLRAQHPEGTHQGTRAEPAPVHATRSASSAQDRLVPGTAAYRQYQANLAAAFGHSEELEALRAEETAAGNEGEPEDAVPRTGTRIGTHAAGRAFAPRQDALLTGSSWAGWAAEGPAMAAVVFRKEEDAGGKTTAIESRAIEEAIRFDTGHLLPELLRRQMERLLGADLSGVRIHAGTRAATAASAAGAKAFTIGPHIFFGQALYQPDSAAGRDLLLHELVHVVQWLRGTVPAGGDLRIAESSDPLEREAEGIAQQLSSSLDRVGQQTRESSGPVVTMERGTKGAQYEDAGVEHLKTERREDGVAAMASGLLLRQVAAETSSSVQILEGGEPVNKVGIIHWDGSPQVRLRATPDTHADNLVAQLPFNTHVQVIKRFPGGWYFVSTPSGQMGYVAATYVWTHLPEPNARLHRVESGRPGYAIAIAERYYGVRADDWGQDLRFYVNVLAWVNNIPVPDTTDGWREVHFQAGQLIWIPSSEFAGSLRGVVNAGSLSYNLADSLGIADFAERVGELWEDMLRAIELSGRYMGEAIRRHVEQALWNVLEALAIMLVAAVAILAVSTAIGAALGSLAGGVGAAPGAAAGFEVGLALLEWLGLALLLVWIGDALLRVGGAFGRFLGTVWGAHGNQATLDQGAREFAEAVGTFMGVILEGMVLLATAHGLGKALGLLRGTRFGQVIGEGLLGRWLSQRVQNVGEGRSPVPSPRRILRGRGQQEGEGGQSGEHGTGEGHAGEGGTGEGNSSGTAVNERGTGERSAGERGDQGGHTAEATEVSSAERSATPSRSYDPATRTDAELRTDLDPNPKSGETTAEATERARLAQEQILQRQLSIYEALGNEPRRINLRAEESLHPDAHTIERHGSDIPLYRSESPSGRTIEGRIYGDPPWPRAENGSARWQSDSIMHCIINDYIRANWEAIRSDLATERRHVAAFDAGRAVGEGFYNGGAHGTGSRSAIYTQTSLVRITIVLDLGPPPSFHVITAFPNILGTSPN